MTDGIETEAKTVTVEELTEGDVIREDGDTYRVLDAPVESSVPAGTFYHVPAMRVPTNNKRALDRLARWHGEYDTDEYVGKLMDIFGEEYETLIHERGAEVEVVGEWTPRSEQEQD